MIWGEVWRASWILLIAIASIVFPYDRLASFFLLVAASQSLTDQRVYWSKKDKEDKG